MNSKIEKIIKLFFKAKKHRGKKNLIKGKNTGFVNCKFFFKGKQNYIEASNCIFYKCKFHFFGSNNKILIGNNCIFKNIEFWIENDNNIISIGDECSFSGRAQLACLEGTKISVGNNLLCSSDVFLRTSDSHSLLNKNGERINFAKDITIGNNVWICQKATILKGSCVPNNSVVAYGSIVTKEFDETNCVIGGNPAKILKANINWSKERL